MALYLSQSKSQSPSNELSSCTQSFLHASPMHLHLLSLQSKKVLCVKRPTWLDWAPLNNPGCWPSLGCSSHLQIQGGKVTFKGTRSQGRPQDSQVGLSDPTAHVDTHVTLQAWHSLTSLNTFWGWGRWWRRLLSGTHLVSLSSVLSVVSAMLWKPPASILNPEIPYSPLIYVPRPPLWKCTPLPTMHAHTHTHIHIYTETHTHTHMHMHTHTHTHTHFYWAIGSFHL